MNELAIMEFPMSTGRSIGAGNVLVAARIHPFEADVTELETRAGGTMRALMGAAGARPHPVAYAVAINGVPIDPEEWDTLRPPAGARMSMVATVTDDGGGKDALRVISLIAIAAAASWAAPVLLGPLALAGSKVAVGAVAAGLTFGGSLALSALVPPQPADMAAGGGTLDGTPPRYSLSGSQNALVQFGCFPRIFGTVRIFPPLGAQPYTEYAGGTQYLRLFFIPGYGPLSFQEGDMLIGETPLELYSDYTLESIDGHNVPLTTTRKLFNTSVRETPLTFLMENPPDEVRTRTEPATDEVILDFTWLSGLWCLNTAGALASCLVYLRIMVSKADQEEWYNIDPLLTIYPYLGNSGEYRRESMRFVLTGVHEATANRQWDIKVTLAFVTVGHAGGPTPTEGSWATTWSAMRSVEWEDPLNISGMSTIALRIRASDQLSGMLKKFSVTATSKLRSWNGAAWSAEQDELSHNPAAAFVEILTGSANKRAVADSRLDLATLGTWYDNCVTWNRKIGIILDQRMTVYEALKLAAYTGHASFGRKDGLFTVVEDLTRSAVQVFTPKNSWGYEGEKSFPPRPHGVKAEFINEDAGFTPDEVTIYDDGYDASNATEFERLTCRGIQHYEGVFRRVRYDMKQARLRPITHRWNADIEAIICQRGDRVELQNDVSLYGLEAGRITALLMAGANVVGITVDEPCLISLSLYGARIRKADGVILLEQLKNTFGLQTDLYFLEPLVPPEPLPEVGDLFTFGEWGSVTHSVVLTDIKARPDLSCRLSGRAYDADVLISGPTPEYDPGTVRPWDPSGDAPATPQILATQADEDVFYRAPDGSLQPRIFVFLTYENTGAAPPAFTELRWRLAKFAGDTPEAEIPWAPAVPFPGDSHKIQVPAENVEVGQTYDLAVRGKSEYGAPGPWAVTFGVYVTGKVSPPPDVDASTLRIEPYAGDVLQWDYDDAPLDLDGFKVRYQLGTSQVWGSASSAHKELVKETLFPLATIPYGTVQVFVKAVDTSGNESENAARIVITHPPQLDAFIIGDSDIHAAGWHDGTDWAEIIEGEIESGTGDLVGTSGPSPLFWGADGESFWGADGEPFWDPTRGYYGNVHYRFNLGGFWLGQLGAPTTPGADSLVHFAAYLETASELCEMTYTPNETSNRGTAAFPGRLSFAGNAATDGAYLHVFLAGGNANPRLTGLQILVQGQWKSEILESVALSGWTDLSGLVKLIISEYKEMNVAAISGGSTAVDFRFGSLTIPTVGAIDGDGNLTTATALLMTLRGW